MTWRGLTLAARLAAGYVVDESGCLLWVKSHNVEGYGRVWLNRHGARAHRVMYEMFVGPIPSGLHLDHLCRVPACVNPYHLEPVTAKENQHRSPIQSGLTLARQTACKRGHPFDEANTRRYVNGTRGCRECLRASGERSRRRRARTLATPPRSASTAAGPPPRVRLGVEQAGARGEPETRLRIA